MANREKGHLAMLKQSVLIGLAMSIASATGVCAMPHLTDAQQFARCHAGNKVQNSMMEHHLVAAGPQKSMADAKEAATLATQNMVHYGDSGYESALKGCLKGEIWAFKNPKLLSHGIQNAVEMASPPRRP